LPDQGLAVPVADSGGRRAELRRGRRQHRRAEGRARGRFRVRRQPDRGARAVSPRAARRRRRRRLPLGRASQACAARSGTPAARGRAMSAGPEARVGRLDWEALARALDDDGVAVTPPLLSRVACRRLRERFDDERTAFRSTIDMSRHNYGSGMYRYFDYPLPPEVQALREAFYPPLAAIAHAWAE